MKDFLTPEKIIQSLNIENGDHVADFGAGHGYFTIPLARAAGNDGKIYAIDIQKPVLEIIRTKAKQEHLFNIETVWADAESPKGLEIKDLFLDSALMANTLFQSEKKEGLLDEAYRILRSEGRLIVIEWDQSLSPMGPPASMRLKKEDARFFAQNAGFEFEKEFDAGSHHYGLLFVKRL